MRHKYVFATRRCNDLCVANTQLPGTICCQSLQNNVSDDMVLYAHTWTVCHSLNGGFRGERGAGRSHLGGSSLPKPPRSFDDRLNSVSAWHMRQQASSLSNNPAWNSLNYLEALGVGYFMTICLTYTGHPAIPHCPPAAITSIASY